MKPGPEYCEVEQPFVDQLVGMGWVHTAGDLDDPSKTGRESFHDVMLVDDLRAALHKINLDDNKKPWLDEARLSQAVNTLKTKSAANLVEANQEATKLLLKGTVVEGVEGWDDGRLQTVQFIDWEHPERNIYRVINQFRVACPIGQTSKFIDPDIVLFVNGIPLVVIECKSPNAPSALEEAVNQLQRYANRRKELGIVDIDEGAEELIRFNQLLVATCFERARVGTFTALACHFLEWKDTAPVPLKKVAAELGKQTLSSQELLVAGMLRPAHLLDIVQHFTLFTEAEGRTIKLVCRYQQFRAVHAAYQRLLTGKTRLQDGEFDRRGGIVWHTQGSGKSLTMVFVIRKMRSHERLKSFKVVVVTDRKDLEKQLADTAELTGEPMTRVRPRKQGARTLSALEVLKETLRLKGKDLVFAMIQKYRGETVTDDDDDGDGDDGDAIPSPVQSEPLEELNADESILVLVDEAHRSHSSAQHANLLGAMPNCARIGFTGTPIIMGAKKRTAEIFGAEIDRYTILQSEKDGATVPVLYDGRTTNAAVQGGGDLDDKFEDMFVERSPKELERIKQKYGTKGNVMEARALIAAKARDMLRHYVANILPNGFKAQVVAVSRRATIVYYEELCAARDELVAQLESIDPALLALSSDELADLPHGTDSAPGAFAQNAARVHAVIDARNRGLQSDKHASPSPAPKLERAYGATDAFLARAHPYLATIKALEFAPVISGGHNDTVDPSGEWTDRTKIDARIRRFKKPLVHRDPAKADPLAFLIVKSMLLTGFDAPVEQVMYLDRPIREAELLQAIARVNRTSSQGGVEKQFGVVVDYYGVGHHLKEALKVYSDQDIEGALVSVKDDIPKLRDLRDRLIELFSNRGVADLGRLSDWDRKQLALRFARWSHENVQDPDKAAVLRDGTAAGAISVLDAFERFLLAPTPVPTGPDPYAQINDKVVSGIKAVLSTSTTTPSQLADATDKLILQIEPAIFKLIAMVDVARFAQLVKKKKGLDVGLRALIELGRSRYTLNLPQAEFEKKEGWEQRTSYENTVRDIVPARLAVAHGSTAPSPTLWQSATAFLLGLADHNLDVLAALPEPEKREVSGQQASIELLRDEKLRAEFHVLLKEFLSTLDTVLPRPEALPYVNDAKVFSYIQAKAKLRYRGDEPLIGMEVGAKVRQLIDEHIESRGIDQKVAPISITDVDFAKHVEEERSPKAKASEMEHALRHHIRKHFGEDPVRYEKLSERLETILEELQGRWEALTEELSDLVAEAVKGRQADESGLDPEIQAPFYEVLIQLTRPRSLSISEEKLLRDTTIELVDHVRGEIKIAGFWKKSDARKAMANRIVQMLDDTNLFPSYDDLPGVAEKVMDLAKANNDKLTKPASPAYKLCRHRIIEAACSECNPA